MQIVDHPVPGTIKQTLQKPVPVAIKSPLQPSGFFKTSLAATLETTNLSGVFTHPAPPADFNPNTASPQALSRYGFFWKRPEPGDDPGLLGAWKKAFGPGWSPANRIIPESVSLPGVVHTLPRPAGQAESAAGPFQWSGYICDGNWKSAFGSFNVPVVSIPREAAGPDGKWHCTPWVGLDGSGTNDVLQAGVNCEVNALGLASYTAWYEWFSPIVKTTLNQTTPVSPAVCTIGDGVLVTAWKGDGNDQLNLIISPASQNATRSFNPAFTSTESSSQAPALCIHKGSLYISWIGSGNNNINIARVGYDPTTQSITGVFSKTTLNETSPFAPALASDGNLLYVAWKGDSNDNINVISAADGEHFGNKCTSPETTSHAPALGGHNGMLFISWIGSGNENINVARFTGNGSTPTGFTNKVTLGETSSDRPALASAQGFLFLSWKGSGNNHLNLMYSADNGASFGHKHTSPETSGAGPSLGLNADGLYIAWKGDGNDNINVSFVGMNNGNILGFHIPAYLFQTNVPNFDVQAGDEIWVSITYLDDHSGGQIVMSNQRLNKYFSIVLPPPPGAQFIGATAEWILEAPTAPVNGVQQPTIIPAFTDVVFQSAYGCPSVGNVIANPKSGRETEIQENGRNVSVATSADGTLTVHFGG